MSERFNLKILTLFLLFLFLGCDKPFAYGKAIKVREVIDGDTIVLESNEVVRYIGIDTPETKKDVGGRWQEVNQPGSYEAKMMNQSLVEGKIIRLEFDLAKKDRYGRLLAYCFLMPQEGVTEEVFINAFLLAQGYALLYTYPPNLKYVELFVESQKQARENQRGLWKDNAIIPADQAGDFINQIKTVKGQVLDTKETEKAIFLNFGKDYRSDFTIVIFKSDLKFFSQKGINPKETYKHRNVLVTGLIKEYNGPEIIIHHPAHIEVLR